MSAVALGSMALLDSGKLYYYLVHSTPYLAAILACAVSAVWPSGRLLRVSACAAVGALLVLHLGWVAHAVRTDPYHKSFRPMAEFVRRQIQSNHSPRPILVMSSAELGFAIGFDGPLADDALLGFASGRRADLIVFDERSYASHYEGFERYRPEVAAHIRGVLQQYRQVYTDGYYRVYAR